MSDSHDTKNCPSTDGANPDVPIGMERLLGLAAVDDRLAEELERDPVALADGCGITLEPTEKAMLSATSGEALRRMISGIRVGLAAPDRREFMRHAAVIVTALTVGGAAAAGGCKKTTPDSGPTGPKDPPDMGAKPPDMDAPPPDMDAPPPDMAAEPDAGAPVLKPPRYIDRVNRGVSPRRPRPLRPRTGTGVRPR